MTVRIDGPLTKEEIRQNAQEHDGEIVVIIAVELERIACSSEDGTLEGLNDIADEEILGVGGGCLMDLAYKPVGVDGDKVLIEVTADPSQVLDEEEDTDPTEEQRRDEKRGLYPQHEDPSN